MKKIVGILFAASCLATSAVSSSLVGVGIWFWIIITTGIAVATSQFIPQLSRMGGKAASSLSILAVCAVVLTLLAATIGGSFELGGSETLLVLSFSMIAILGFLLARMNKPSSENSAE